MYFVQPLHTYLLSQYFPALDHNIVTTTQTQNALSSKSQPNPNLLREKSDRDVVLDCVLMLDK